MFGHTVARCALISTVSPSVAQTDASLLAGSLRDPELFGVFYDRHLPAVTAYLHHNVRDREAVADLVAEVFAAALAHRSKYRPMQRAPVAALARRKLIDRGRRARTADSAQHALIASMPTFTEDDYADLDTFTERGTAPLTKALAALDPTTRALLTARVVDEQPYEALARELGCSEQTVRKRVSRGLAKVRSALETP